jgi:hypothetical protein
MSRDLHPALKYQAELDGWSQGADIDRDAFTVVQQFKMAMHQPEQRRQALAQIDQALSAEDGQTLRSKSQLFDLRRKLSQTHEALLKAGR